ncbi:hypothetical protein WAB17_13735 [Parerythrobacter aurantius]|uniref:hypothetical protein n=1 Tax=Parerythrobacter aurantius TaxID=3127706 RepID=UPI00324A6D3C
MKSAVLASSLMLGGAAIAAAGDDSPVNPALADSSWPIFHRNTYAQAAGSLPAPRPNDRLVAQRQDSAPGGTSPWTVLGTTYDDGSQPVWGSTRKGVVKHLLRAEKFEQIGFVDLSRGWFEFDWNLAVLADGNVLTTNRRRNSYVLVGDARPECPECDPVAKRQIAIPKDIGEITVHFTVAYDGTLIGLLEKSRLVAVDLATGKVKATFDMGLAASDVSFHNAFPIDETGRLILASQEAVTAVDWTGQTFRRAWTASYDFRGPGCTAPKRASKLREVLKVARGETCTGSGTTPTLLGDPQSGVMITVDGHAPQNNLVAFWRGDIPADWKGLPGLDRRVAGLIALPRSSPEGKGFTAENSPAVLGNSVFVAQWAGFKPGCDAPRGVQRVDWDKNARRFRLVWVNEKAHFNGVPTASLSSGLVFGVGRGDDCRYHYRGLDIVSGAISLDLPLSDGAEYNDQGNQHTVAADRSILFASEKGLVRIRPD